MAGSKLDRAAAALKNYRSQVYAANGAFYFDSEVRGMAKAVLAALKYVDGADEDALLKVSSEEQVEGVSLGLAWDALLDAALGGE